MRIASAGATGSVGSGTLGDARGRGRSAAVITATDTAVRASMILLLPVPAEHVLCAWKRKVFEPALARMALAPAGPCHTAVRG